MKTVFTLLCVAVFITCFSMAVLLDDWPKVKAGFWAALWRFSRWLVSAAVSFHNFAGRKAQPQKDSGAGNRPAG